MVSVVQINADEAAVQYKRSAAIDAKKRNEDALKKNPDFFNSRQTLLAQVDRLIGRKYSITDRRYVNYRPGGNGHKPAVAIKIGSPSIKSSKLQELFLELDAVAPDIIFQENVNTGAHIYLIQ